MFCFGAAIANSQVPPQGVEKEGTDRGSAEVGVAAQEEEEEAAAAAAADLSGGSGDGEAEPGEGVLAQLRSEDSGLGISASPSEQQLLRPGVASGSTPLSKEGEDVWRKGGSVDTMTQHLTDILAFITTR